MGVRVRWFPQSFNRKLGNDLNSRTKKAADLYASHIKSSFGTSGFPEVRSGALKNSIKVVRTGSGKDIQHSVTSDKDYALFLEFGTRNMPAKPFFRPILARLRSKLAAIFRG